MLSQSGVRQLRLVQSGSSAMYIWRNWHNILTSGGVHQSWSCLTIDRWIPPRLKHFGTCPSSLLLFSTASLICPTPHYYHRSWIFSLPRKVCSNRKLKEHYHCILIFICSSWVCDPVCSSAGSAIPSTLLTFSPDPVPYTLKHPVCLLWGQLGLPALASSCTLPFTLPTPLTIISLFLTTTAFVPSSWPTPPCPGSDCKSSASKQTWDRSVSDTAIFGIYLCHFFLYHSPLPSSSQDPTLKYSLAWFYYILYTWWSWIQLYIDL